MSHKLVSLYIGDGEYYTRIDADAVIAELEKRISMLKDKANYNEFAYKRKSEELADTCRFYDGELRRHKYKRCYRIVKDCRRKLSEWKKLRTIFCNPEEDGFELAKAKVALWTKWEARWQDIAEKFKEAK